MEDLSPRSATYMRFTETLDRVATGLGRLDSRIDALEKKRTDTAVVNDRVENGVDEFEKRIQGY